jgi:hypothetical protein
MDGIYDTIRRFEQYQTPTGENNVRIRVVYLGSFSSCDSELFDILNFICKNQVNNPQSPIKLYYVNSEAKIVNEYFISNNNYFITIPDFVPSFTAEMYIAKRLSNLLRLKDKMTIICNGANKDVTLDSTLFFEFLKPSQTDVIFNQIQELIKKSPVEFQDQIWKELIKRIEDKVSPKICLDF